MNLDILFEDKDLIVINKPAGITVHPAPGNKDGTLVNGVLYHCKDLPGINGKLRPGIVHRLDKETSGCIVIAKTQEALVNLQRQIQKRIATRNYWAVVHGVPKGEEGTIIANIGRHPVDRKKYSVTSNEIGRYACTHWKLIERLGDQKYSRCRKLPIDLPGQVLHAIELTLEHPNTGERMIFQAPLPEIFARLLNLLRNRK